MLKLRQLFTYDNVLVECLGDPHLGKRFNAGVPLHRKGEREKIVWEDFCENIIGTKANLHVCMGDLFDNFIVDPTTMLMAAAAYKAGVHNNPNTKYVILMGNHDMSRDVSKISSFGVFKELVSSFSNIFVVDEPMWFGCLGAQFAFFPYHPFKTSYEIMSGFIKHAEAMQGRSMKFDAIFGHWDLDSFGEMPHNIFPHELAATITKDAYTGHIHLPDERSWGPNEELVLTVIGSMQPYNHSEDPKHQLYVTLTMDMLRNTDPSTLKDKCVRLVLGPNDEAPESIDCLQYTTKNMDALEDDDDLDVVLEDFDFRQIIISEMNLQGVTDPSVLTFVTETFERLRSEESIKG